MRYPFGGDGSSALLDLTTGNLLTNATDGDVYTAVSGGSPLADVTSDQAGTTFLDHVSTNSLGIPTLFYGPDGVKQVFVQFGAGRYRLDSSAGLKQAMDAVDRIDALQGIADTAVTILEVGAANGVAALDSSGKVPAAQLPAGLGGGADLDSLVVNGVSPVAGNLHLTPADILAAPATGIPTTAVTGLETRLAQLEVGGAPVTAAAITDATSVGRAVVTAADAPAARTAIGAGTSSLVLGSTAGTAKDGAWKPASTDITNITATGQALVVAANAAAAKTAVGLGSVDNTADAAKPVSTAQAAAIATKQNVIRHYATQAAAAAGLAAGEFGDGDYVSVG